MCTTRHMLMYTCILMKASIRGKHSVYQTMSGVVYQSDIDIAIEALPGRTRLLLPCTTQSALQFLFPCIIPLPCSVRNKGAQILLPLLRLPC